MIEKLPDLPATLANSCGVLIGNVVYIAGGQKNASDLVASDNFWSLDLSAPEKGWQILSTWPGSPRMLSVAGTAEGSFYLFSGVALKEGKREYLNDAFRFTPDGGWQVIKDLPAPVVAAPSPAYNLNDNNLLIFGGDDGKLAAQAADLKEKHPGFSRAILNYDVVANNWTVAGQVAAPAPVTTPLVVWNNKVVLPGGEVRPATRTPNVLIVSINEAKTE
ncbi:N-acetylneuraminate epimerase precursor [compost metagenome]